MKPPSPFGIRRTGRNARRGFRSRPEFGVQDRPQGPPLPLHHLECLPEGALGEQDEVSLSKESLMVNSQIDGRLARMERRLSGAKSGVRQAGEDRSRIALASLAPSGLQPNCTGGSVPIALAPDYGTCSPGNSAAAAKRR